MRRTLIALILSLAALHLAMSLRGQDQLARPPITGITYVRLWSADTHAAGDFYTKILGLIPHEAGCAGMIRPCYMVNDHQQISLAGMAPGSHANLLAEVAFATPNGVGMNHYLQAHNIPVEVVTRDFNGTVHFALHNTGGLRITFVQPAVHRPQFTAPANQISTRLIHAGFIVLDRAAEDKFYKDILGFHVYWHGGMKDDESNWVDMQVPDGTDWLEYMLNVPANADKHTLGVMNHIALGVPDIQAALRQLRANGWSGTEQPKIGRDGKWQLNLYDPDGTRVELMEFTPVQKPCCSDYTGPHPKP